MSEKLSDNQEGVKQFLLDANKEGYASGNTGKRQPDGSFTIEFEKGTYRLNDNYFGGEPYGGREVVFVDGKAVWMMVYYGYVDPSVTDIGEVYAFLQKALSQAPTEMPLRGPKVFEEGDLKYENTWRGALDSFSGQELITKNKKSIYGAKYLGGEVDKREE